MVDVVHHVSESQSIQSKIHLVVNPFFCGERRGFLGQLVIEYTEPRKTDLLYSIENASSVQKMRLAFQELQLKLRHKSVNKDQGQEQKS